jgi:hypothetical protein
MLGHAAAQQQCWVTQQHLTRRQGDTQTRGLCNSCNSVETMSATKATHVGSMSSGNGKVVNVERNVETPMRYNWAAPIAAASTSHDAGHRFNRTTQSMCGQ